MSKIWWANAANQNNSIAAQPKTYDATRHNGGEHSLQRCRTSKGQSHLENGDEARGSDQVTICCWDKRMSDPYQEGFA